MKQKIEKCLFIISQLMNGGKSLKELNERWSSSEYFDKKITPKSFGRYKNEIAEIFKIDIDYNKTQLCYEIYDVESIKKNKLYSYLLSAYHVHNLSLLSMKHKDKILLPKPPDGAKYLSIVLEAIDRKQKMLLHKKTTSYTITPCFLKVWDNRWYLIAHIEKEEDATFISLDTVDDLELIDKYYNEKPDCFYEQIENNHSQEERIIVQYSSSLIDRIIKFPFHPSQKNIGEGVFCYEIALTEEFYSNLLALGENFEVLSPPYARIEVRRIAKMIYNKHQT